MRSQNTPSPAKAIASRKSAMRPHRVTLHLNDEAMGSLEQEMTTFGYSNADALVERLLREHVERRVREEKLREESERIVTTESGRRVRVQQMRRLNLGFSIRSAKSDDGSPPESVGIPIPQSRELFRIESEVRSPACEVSVREFRSTSVSGRVLVIQTFYDDLDGTSRLSSHLSLGRTSIPWLIDALLQADAAIEVELARNRKTAQEARGARSREEVTHHQETKRAYTERYSKERVEWATRLAGRHRSRARRIELKDHFTAWQWLDLCAQTDFRCVSCGALANLEPHHRKDLSAGGANTIDNIEPLCRYCHRDVDLEPHELAELWLRQQQKLYQSFHVGERVRRKTQTPQSHNGTIIELLEPLQGDIIPGLRLSMHYKEKEVELSAPAIGWAKAKALVTWPWGGAVRNIRVALSDLVKVDAANLDTIGGAQP